MEPTMTANPLRARLRRLARSERGMALPVALFAMIASIAVAGAAVVATVEVQHSSGRDGSAKNAIAAADAGANVARARMSRYAYVLSEATPCLRLGAGGKLEGSSAETIEGVPWCPSIAGTVGGGTYVYRVSPVGFACGSYDLCVVSTGTVGGVSRRIEVTYNESSLFSSAEEETNGEGSGEEEGTGSEDETGGGGIEGMVGQDGIELSGNADIRVGIGTNGDVVSSGNASVCGSIRHGIGKKWTHSGNASQCNGYNVSEGNMTLPPVSSFMPTDIATDNSNYRLVKCQQTKPLAEPTGCQSDTLSGGSWTTTKPWDATTRTISLEGNATLTVGGGDYWICALSLSGNSELIMAAGAHVRFFFDTPEHCNTTTQISLSGNNRIAATGYQPSAGQFSMPGFYLLGSTSVSSSVNLSGNYSTTDEFIVYGPNTNISITGNATFKGVIAGKRIAMSGNGKVEQDAGFELPPELNPGAEEEPEGEGEETEGEHTSSAKATARYFTPQSYFECSGTVSAGTAPNAEC
jgi:hypothetical protein